MPPQFQNQPLTDGFENPLLTDHLAMPIYLPHDGTGRHEHLIDRKVNTPI